MLPNLYTSLYGNYGKRPLNKELPKILKLLKDDTVESDLKLSLICYTVKRAAVQRISINYKKFEKKFLDLSRHKKTREDFIDYGDCCFAFSFYYFKNYIFPKKSFRYLKESIHYSMDDSHKYSRFILLAYFYFNGFGIKKNIEKGIECISKAEKIYYKNGGIVECELKIH